MINTEMQEALDVFVEMCDGRGRCVNESGLCIYIGNGHSGCAIGCQPGFAPMLLEHQIDPRGKSVRQLMQDHKVIRKWAEERGLSASFLYSLQELHDSSSSWMIVIVDSRSNNQMLDPRKVQSFCDRWNLKMPPLKYKRVRYGTRCHNVS